MVFVSGTARKNESAVTFHYSMAKDAAERLEMGARIKDLRKQHGYRQQHVADACDVGLRTYQFWEAGKHRPEQEALEKLAALYDVTTVFVLRGPTPELFANQDEGQLARIERKLDDLFDLRHSSLSQILEAVEGLRDHLERELAIRVVEALGRIERADRSTEDPPVQTRP